MNMNEAELRHIIEEDIEVGEWEERQVQPRVAGKPFRCTMPFPGFYCGGNVFTEYKPLRYRCNSCGECYAGEK
jgi:hypothetical protein